MTLITSFILLYIYITGENTTELRIGQIACVVSLHDAYYLCVIPTPDTDTWKESLRAA